MSVEYYGCRDSIFLEKGTGKKEHNNVYFLHVSYGSRIQKIEPSGDGERRKGSLVTKGEFTIFYPYWYKE